MADVVCWLCDPFGARVFPLAHYDKLTYNRAINAVSELTITLPETFDTTLVRVDGQVQVWRNGALDTETAWFVRKIRTETNNQRITKHILTAYSGLYLVSGRHILADFGSPATKTGPADDSMKAYVRENLGTLATTDRQVPAALFAVAADLGQGGSVTHEGARQDLLHACQDLAKASMQVDVPLFFDVVYLPDTGVWEFRTYREARGIDKSSWTGAPVTLSIDYGSIGFETLEDDYSNEATALYAVGSGSDGGRAISTQVDTERSGRSPFGRRERYLSAGGDDLIALDTLAKAELYRGRPRRTFVADVIPTSASQYGRDWNYGDIVTAHSFGRLFNCRVDAVGVTVDNLDGGRETVRVKLTDTAAL